MSGTLVVEALHTVDFHYTNFSDQHAYMYAAPAFAENALRVVGLHRLTLPCALHVVHVRRHDGTVNAALCTLGCLTTGCIKI